MKTPFKPNLYHISGPIVHILNNLLMQNDLYPSYFQNPIIFSSPTTQYDLFRCELVTDQFSTNNAMTPIHQSLWSHIVVKL